MKRALVNVVLELRFDGRVDLDAAVPRALTNVDGARALVVSYGLRGAFLRLPPRPVMRFIDEGFDDGQVHGHAVDDEERELDAILCEPSNHVRRR